MSLLGIILLAASLVTDVVGQVAFKVGIDRHAAGPWQDSWLGLSRQPWIWIGVVNYTLEFVLWLAVLEIVPLSIAFPVAALSYCGVVLVCRLFLGEHVSRRRWSGVLLVSAGVLIICAQA